MVIGWFSQSLNEEVFEYLESIRVSDADFNKESELEEIIYNRLTKKFDKVHRQFNVEGYVGAKIDIDIQEEVGIEIKLANQLKKADQIHRLFGQVIYYSKRKYDDNIIVIIAGNKDEISGPLVDEVVDFLEDTQDVGVIRLRTTQKRKS